MVTATRGQGDEEEEEEQHMRGAVSMPWQPLIGGACKVRRPITRLAAARVKAVCGGGEDERSDSSIDSFHGWPGAPVAGRWRQCRGWYWGWECSMCSASQINQGRRLMRLSITHLPDHS